MVIERCYTGETEWEEITEQEFIRRIEFGNFLPKGTAIKTLSETGKIDTPFALYRMKEGEGIKPPKERKTSKVKRKKFLKS